jgi:hypothetical protein
LTQRPQPRSVGRRTPWRCPTCGHYRAGTPLEQLEFFVDRSGGPDACWPFTGALSNAGYGAIQLYLGGRRAREVRAHRLAFALAQGFTGDDADRALGAVVVRHLCDGRYARGDISYRACCNPAHLAGGTQGDNHAHMWDVGRQSDYSRQARGEGVTVSKLTAAKVLEMRRRFASGETAVVLGAEYGVSQAAAWNVIHGVTWAHVPEAQPRRGRGRGGQTGRGGWPKGKPRGPRKTT